jgi:hypothetical protein
MLEQGSGEGEEEERLGRKGGEDYLATEKDEKRKNVT